MISIEPPGPGTAKLSKTIPESVRPWVGHTSARPLPGRPQAVVAEPKPARQASDQQKAAGCPRSGRPTLVLQG